MRKFNVGDVVIVGGDRRPLTISRILSDDGQDKRYSFVECAVTVNEGALRHLDEALADAKKRADGVCDKIAETIEALSDLKDDFDYWRVRIVLWEDFKNKKESGEN